MKRVLILLAILALAATPVMAKQQKLEAGSVQKHATTKKHAANKTQKKHLKKKLAKHTTRKHKVTV